MTTRKMIRSPKPEAKKYNVALTASEMKALAEMTRRWNKEFAKHGGELNCEMPTCSALWSLYEAADKHRIENVRPAAADRWIISLKGARS